MNLSRNSCSYNLLAAVITGVKMLVGGLITALSLALLVRFVVDHLLLHLLNFC